MKTTKTRVKKPAPGGNMSMKASPLYRGKGSNMVSGAPKGDLSPSAKKTDKMKPKRKMGY